MMPLFTFEFSDQGDRDVKERALIYVFQHSANVDAYYVLGLPLSINNYPQYFHRIHQMKEHIMKKKTELFVLMMQTEPL